MCNGTSKELLSIYELADIIYNMLIAYDGQVLTQAIARERANSIATAIGYWVGNEETK